jgi:hypothetical protein
MRVTLVDSLGRPVPGLCSTVTTSGFVNIEMTAENEEGEETIVRTAGGELCISERGADQLKWINVSIEFCLVDPDLLSMINPTWTKLLDHNGNTIGWEESHSYSIDTGFALEAWSDVSGFVATDSTAQGSWVYYLLPFIVGGTLGDITIENGAVSFTITGRTKKGSQWGKGPYNVMANPPDGTCGPLITPFSPEAPRRIFLTTCRPPEPTCGCQPLSAPDGPNVTVTEVTTDTNRMTVRAYASGSGPFTVNWGDGNTEDLPAGLTGLTHAYGASGSYVISVYPTATPSKVTYSTVTLPYTGTTPPLPLVISVTEDTADLTRRTAEIEWNNGTSGTVRIEWGDSGSTAGQAQTGTATHAYTNPGSYLIRVVDESDATRVETETITVPFGPVATVTEDTDDTDRRTVIVTVNNYGKGQVTIDWGQVGAPTTTNVGDGVTESSYKYTAGGTYEITITDSDEASRTTTATVEVPFGDLPPTIVAIEDTADATGMTTKVTVDNHGNGTVNISWGDASSPSSNTGDGIATSSHLYATGGTYTVTATDANEPSRTSTTDVTVPYP